MKKSLILTLILLVIPFPGCKEKYIDPLLGLKIGSSESEWKERINVLVTEGKLTKANYENYYFGYILDSTQVRIQTNTDVSHGKLLNYKIGFIRGGLFAPNLDRLINDPYFPYKSTYTLTKEVLNNLINLYGKPDSLILIDGGEKIFEGLLGEPLIDSLIGNFRAVWTLKDYNIFYNVGGLSLTQDTLSKSYRPADNFECYLEYQHPNYNKEVQEITDFLISNYKIGDYIESEVDDPQIIIGDAYSIPDREISFDLITFTRLDNIDNRAIISVLVDIVLLDNFENELSRIDDVEFDFGKYKLVTTERQSKSLPTIDNISGRIVQYETNSIMIFDKTYTYYSRSSAGKSLELAFQKGTTIKAKLVIKAIKFDDSDVLKL